MTVEQPSDRDGGPYVRQVVRSPNESAIQKYGGVEVLENLPLPAKEIERNREEGTNGETPQETVVDGTRAKHPLWSKGTPKDGRGEESADTGAGEVVLLIRCTNIGDLRHLVVEDTRADESRNKGGEHLAVEGNPRWNVDVMSEFEVLGETESVCGGDMSVKFEVHQGGGVTGEPETAEQFGNDAEGDLHVGNSHDYAARNAKDDCEEDTIQRSGGGGIGRVNGDNSGTNADGDTQNDEVDPLGNLFVRPHQADVDVLGVGEGRFATDQVLEARNDLAAVMQNCVGNDRRIYRKVGGSHDGVAGGQTGNATSTEPDRKQRVGTY